MSKFQGPALGFAVFLLPALLAPAIAQDKGEPLRVNNVWLSSAEVEVLGVLNCGQPVPGGHYWIDFATGAWGHMGQPQQGRLPCYDMPVEAGRRQVSARE